MSDWFAPVVRRVLAPLDAWRSGSGHYRILADLRRSQYLPAEELERRALEKLNRIVRYAYNNCQFYRHSFAEAGYNPSDEITRESFRQLPELSKRDIQNNRDRMVSDQFEIADLVSNQTGGSTGEPLKMFHDPQRSHSRLAATLRHDEWAGFRPGDKFGLLWGAPRDMRDYQNIKSKLRSSLIERVLPLNATEITESKLEEYYHRLNDFKPVVLLAYAHTLYVFALFLQSREWRLPSLRSLITSAELLSARERKVIEEVFATEVFDRYGCREMSVVASECQSHQGMHINAENIYVEILSGDSPTPVGKAGELTLTDLENRGMPLIRYRIADSASPLAGECSCGRTLPRLAISGGRVNEFIVTASGSLVAGTAMTIFLSTAVPGVAQMQLYQSAPGELVFRVVRADGFIESVLLEKGREFFGSDMKLSIDYREHIEREPSGKYRFSISEVAAEYFMRGASVDFDRTQSK